MLDGAPLAWWIGFHIAVVVLIVLDLAVLGRVKPENQTRINIGFVLLLLVLATIFGTWIGLTAGHQSGLEFASGYLIELSLSIDNLFVFLLMFRSFGLEPQTQRRALLFGFVGAIVMRGIFIFAGIALLERFAWIQYVFGALLVVAALRLLKGEKNESGPTPARQFANWIRGTAKTDTALFIFAIISVELVDLVFALDSVPAVLAVSHHPFVVYTSNICAILGLRALYFLLADLLDRLEYLHFGLAAILGFVGLKMLLAHWIEVPIVASLGFIVLVVAVSAIASLVPHAGKARH